MLVRFLPPWARLALMASLFTLCLSVTRATGDDLIPWRGVWRYADDGTDRYAQSPKFHQPAYDAAGWRSGVGRFGYGGDGESTRVSFGTNASLKHPSTYFRHEFIWDGTIPKGTDILLMEFSRDDGAAIYLNGSLIERSNLPAGEIRHSTRAVASISGTGEVEMIQKEIDPTLLVSGRNVVAVSVHQSDLTSSDLGFDLRLAFARKTRFFGQEELVSPPHTIAQLLGLLDLTGDGAPDLLAARETNPGSQLELWVNDGLGHFETPLVIDEDAGYPSTLSTIDLNGDELPDLVLGSGVRVYRNDGAGRFTLTLKVTDESSVDPEGADLNGDGKQDIIEWSYTDTQPVLQWRRRLEGDEFAAPLVLFTVPTGAPSSSRLDFSLLDANGDGRLDALVIVPGSSDVRLLTNQGDDALTFAVKTVASGLPNVRHVQAADLDGDGDEDFVTLSPADVPPGTRGRIDTFLNDGSASFVRAPGMRLTATWDGPALLQDVDNDEDPDLLCLMSNVGNFELLENDGRGNWVNQRTPTSSDSSFRPDLLALGDVDGDRRLDAVLASTNRFRPIYWYRNTEGGAPVIRSFTASPQTLGQTATSTLAWQVENATSVELDPPAPLGANASTAFPQVDRQTTFTLTARNADGMTQAKRTVFMANHRWSSLLAGPTVYAFGHGAAMIDMNADGRLDLVVESYIEGDAGSAGIYWSPMTPQRTFGPLQRLLTGAASSTPSQAVDLNGDDRPDLVAGITHSGLFWIPVLANGQLEAPRRLVTASLADPLYSFAVGDFDGDDDADIVLSTMAGPLRFLLNDGTGGFSDGLPLSLPAGYPNSPLKAVDADRDGRTDLVIPRESGDPFIAWNDYPNGFIVSDMRPLRNRRIDSTHLADVTGDGHLDLLTTQGGPEIFLEIGRGDRGLGTRPAVSIVPPDGERDLEMLTSDLEGDGDLDLVVARDEAGVPLYYSLNDGTGSFSGLVPVTSSEIGTRGVRSFVLGDLDGDGDQDAAAIFFDTAAAVFNEGPPPPVVRIPASARLSEDKPETILRFEVNGVIKPLTLEIELNPASFASEILLGPPEQVIPVLGEPGRWTLVLQPGAASVSLTLRAIDDTENEALETAELIIRAKDPVLFNGEAGSQSFTVMLAIRESDFVFPATTDIERLADGSILLRFRQLGDQPYAIDRSTNLLEWTEVGRFLPSPDGTVEYLVLPDPQTKGYLRLRDPRISD